MTLKKMMMKMDLLFQKMQSFKTILMMTKVNINFLLFLIEFLEQKDIEAYIDDEEIELSDNEL